MMALSTDQTNPNFVGAGDGIDGKWLSELLLERGILKNRRQEL